MKKSEKKLCSETELILRAKKGDICARNKIIEDNISFIKKIAAKTICTGTLSESDLINEGVFALVVALEKFNPALGYKFQTYAAWWIKQGLFKAVSEQSYIYKIPVYAQETISRYNKIKSEMEQKQQKVSTKDVAQKLKISEKKIDALLGAFTKTISFDSGVRLTDNKEITLADIIEDEKQNVEKEIVESELKEDIKAALDNLCEKERNVIVLRFGLEEKQKQTLEQIGNSYGVTKECIRRIEKKALDKIAHLDFTNTRLKTYIV